jgi:Uma2 family endonuclease
LAGEISGRPFQYVEASSPLRKPVTSSDRIQTPPAPDVSLVSKDRIGDSVYGEGYFPGAPDFLVEVVSPSDSFADVQEKVYLWLAGGARLGVVILPRERACFVYRTGRVFSGSDLRTLSTSPAGI